MDKETIKKMSLEDLLTYEVDSYLSTGEIALIRNTFRNPALLKVLRKVLLPSVGDPDLPIEEMAKDVWLTGRDYSMIPDAEIKSIVLARQEAIKFIIGGLVQLKIIAGEKTETAMEKALRLKKDSQK